MCHPCPGADLRALRLQDHGARRGDRECLVLLCSLCLTAWCPQPGRSCRGAERGTKLSEIMTREVEVIQPDDTLQAAAKKMRDRNIGFLPVCDGEVLMGVLSDRDITIRALADSMDLNVMLCRDLMTTPTIYCLED